MEFYNQIKQRIANDKNFFRYKTQGNIYKEDGKYYLKHNETKILLPFSEEEEFHLLDKMIKYPQHTYLELIQFGNTEPILCMVYEKGSDKKGFEELEEEVIHKYCEHYKIDFQ